MISQISVFLENRAGQLVELTGALKDAGIDMRAINIAETADYGIVRMIADKPGSALKLLKSQGFLVSVSQVVVVPVPDTAGGLHTVLTYMADAHVNIQYMYSVFGENDNIAYMVFNVSEPEELEKILASVGVSSAKASEIGITEEI